MLHGFQNTFKTEICLTVHQLLNLRDLLIYVNHVTHKPALFGPLRFVVWRPDNMIVIYSYLQTFCCVQ